MKKAKTQPAKSPGSSADREDPRQFLEYLLVRHEAQGGVTELRGGYGLKRATHRAYLKPEDLDTAVSLLASVCGTVSRSGKTRRPPAITCNPHPVSCELYATSPAKFTRGEPAGSGDLVAHSMFSVRLTPYRREFDHASDEGRTLALAVAQDVVTYLAQLTVPATVIDAGDWYEVLIPLRPCEDIWRAVANAEKLHRLFDNDFSTDAVLVGGPDSVYAIHPVPLPGTLLANGNPSAERPPRLVGLLGPPEASHDVDLFGLLAPDLAALPIYEPDDPPDGPDEPVAGVLSHEKEPHVAVVVAEAATEPAAPKPPKPKKKPLPPVDEPPAEGSDGCAVGTAAHTMATPVAQWEADTAGRVLAAVLGRGDHEYHVKNEKGECHYRLEVCPNFGEPDGNDHKCFVVVRADGRYAFRCLHDENATWKELKPNIRWQEHIKGVLRDLGVPPRSLRYRASDSGLVDLVRIGKRVERVALSSFDARIVGDILEDDGVETRRTLEIEARLHGETYNFTLPATKFQAMKWPLEYLGARAVIHPEASKGRLLAAIQSLSAGVVRSKVYTHLGWRRHGGRWVYLHGDGAVGEGGVVPGVQVRLPKDLSLYRLPAPPEGDALRDAVRAAMRLLDAAPDAITVPLSAGIWRVVVGPADFSLHLVGPSGSGKTALVTLSQQHWGPEMNPQNLPATWMSSANANEYLAFLAQNAVLAIDDFVPQGGGTGTARQRQEADRLFRGQGNNAGRARLGSPPTPPRGIIYSTGEAMPAGHSMRARVLVVGLGADSLDWGRVTACQQDAAKGLYAAAMAGYIRWLAPRLDQVRQDMPARLAALRQEAAAGDLHRRTPTIVADLAFGLELFAEFAVDAKAMTKKQAGEFRARCWDALGEAAAAQAGVQTHGEPAQRFLALLRTAVAAGNAHVVGRDGNRPEGAESWGWRLGGEVWSACGTQIGWVDGAALYLDPEAAFAVARSAAKGGEPLTVGAKTLHKRLNEGGFLTQVDEKRDRLLVRKTIAGKQREVLVLSASALVPLPQPLPPEPPALPPEPPGPSPEPPAMPPGG